MREEPPWQEEGQQHGWNCEEGREGHAVCSLPVQMAGVSVCSGALSPPSRGLVLLHTVARQGDLGCHWGSPNVGEFLCKVALSWDDAGQQWLASPSWVASQGHNRMHPHQGDGAPNAVHDGSPNGVHEAVHDDAPNGVHDGAHGAHDAVHEAVHDGAPDCVHDGAPDSVHDGAHDSAHDGAPDGVHDDTPNAVPDGAPDGAQAHVMAMRQR